MVAPEDFLAPLSDAQPLFVTLDGVTVQNPRSTHRFFFRGLANDDLEAALERSAHPYAGEGGTGKAYTAMPYRLSCPGGERSLRQAKRDSTPAHMHRHWLRGQAMLLSRRNAAAAAAAGAAADYGYSAGAAAGTPRIEVSQGAARVPRSPSVF